MPGDGAWKLCESAQRHACRCHHAAPLLQIDLGAVQRLSGLVVRDVYRQPARIASGGYGQGVLVICVVALILAVHRFCHVTAVFQGGELDLYRIQLVEASLRVFGIPGVHGRFRPFLIQAYFCGGQITE